MTTTKALPLPAAGATSTPRKRAAFLLAAGSMGAMLASSGALTPFYPTLESELGISSLGISLVFAVYAITLLFALLVAGALSDHIGRRPVVSIGFGILSLSVVTVAFIDSAPALFAARALQGAATGLLTPALSALLIDSAPAEHTRRSSLLNATTPTAGLAIGSLIGGVAIVLVTPALPVTFITLAVIYAAVAAGIWLLPETSARTPGALRSLLPRVSVPQPARRLFLISAPALAATWATGGLFLSLGPSIIIERLHSDSALLEGAIVAILPAAGVLAVVALRRLSPRSVSLIGTVSLAAGTAFALVTLTIGSVLGYVVAVVITGIGFGSTFYGIIGSLAPKAPVHDRAGLFAGVYVVSYLSFGLPAVAAGMLATVTSLSIVSTGYGIVVVALASVAAIARARSRE